MRVPGGSAFSGKGARAQRGDAMRCDAMGMWGRLSLLGRRVTSREGKKIRSWRSGQGSERQVSRGACGERQRPTGQQAAPQATSAAPLAIARSGQNNHRKAAVWRVEMGGANAGSRWQVPGDGDGSRDEIPILRPERCCRAQGCDGEPERAECVIAEPPGRGRVQNQASGKPCPGFFRR
jgi:hypothetical protein